MKVLIFTNLFPNPIQTLRGNFTANIVQEMSKLADTTVVSPLPWFPNLSGLRKWSDKLNLPKQNWGQFSEVPYFNRWNGLDVYYPKYPFIPVLLRLFHPALIALSVSGLIRKLIKEKKIDIMNAHWIYPDGISTVWMGKNIGIPTVVTALGCDINLYGQYRLRRPQIVWALRNTQKITTVSNALSEKICNEFNIEKKKVTVIPNGVDRNKFNIMNNKIDIKNRLGLVHNKKYLIFVGQLHEVKGVNYLIEALHILKGRDKLSFHAILIGEGMLRDDLTRLIKEKKLEKYIFLKGNKPNEEIPFWMNACDVLCLPSKREGLPNVILEALSCGLPVVASDVGGVPEIVNKNSGLLVKPQNPLALASVIEIAFQKDWNREKISHDMEKFSWSRSAELYVKAFEEVLRGK